MTVRAQLEAAEAAAAAGGAALLKISSEVRIGGQVVTGVLAWTVEHGLDIINSTATVTLATRPALAEELAALELWAGYNGDLEMLFKGEIISPEWSYAPGTVTLRGLATLARVRASWGGADQTWSNISDGDLVVAILELYGIYDYTLDSSSWMLGTIQDVELLNGESGWALIEEIDRLAGYVTFSGPDGRVYRRRVSGAPGAGYVWRYAKGENILEARRVRTLEGIYNKAVVSGLEYEGVSVEGSASASNPYIPATPGAITLDEQSDLVETDSVAEEIAERLVADNNRRPESLELTVAGNPLLQPGHTIRVEHADLETGVAQLLIEHLSHSLSGAELTTSLRTLGGTLSGYNASAPVVEFDVKIFREYSTSAGAAEYVLVATSTSFDPDGSEEALVLAWAISGTGGTPSPTSGTEPVFRSVLPGATTSVTISLTATDPEGLVGTQTRVITISAGMLLREDLWLAIGTLAAVSSDGEQSWRTTTLPGGATTAALAPFAPPWGQIWGASNGHGYGTFDKLRSALVDLGQPFGTADELTAVSVHELDDTRIWVGNSAGKVAFGLLDIDAQSVTWTVVTDLPEGPVKEIREAYSTFGALRAQAGTSYYRSEDGGASWTAIDSGDTSWRMAAGRDLNLYSFLNDSEPLRDEGGVAFTWPVLTPPVRHVRGVTIGWRVAEVYAADDQARLFKGIIGTSPIAMTTPATNVSGVNHMLRSGNIDGKIYLACDNGLYAWLPATGYLQRVYATASPVAMLAYGLSHGPEDIVSAEIWLGTTAAAAAWGLYHRVGTVWSSLIAAPHASAKRLVWAAVNPFDPDQLLVLWNSSDTAPTKFDVASSTFAMRGTTVTPLWHYNAATSTWTAIPLPHPYRTTYSAGVFSVADVGEVAWSDVTPGDWMLIGGSDTIGPENNTTYWWRGSGTGAAVLQGTYISGFAFGSLVAGVDDDLITATQFPSGSRNLRYAPNGGTSLIVPSGAQPLYSGAISGVMDRDTTAGRSVAFGDVAGDIWATSDYRAVQPTQRLTGVGRRLAYTTHGWYVGYNITTVAGLLRITDLLTSPTVAAAAGGGLVNINFVRSDRQTRSVVAALLASSTPSTSIVSMYILDAAGVSQINGPAGVVMTHLADHVEVVVRTSDG